MNYTFTNKDGEEQTVDIPMDYIHKQMASLSIGAMEACKLYLSDEGYIDNPEAEELTNKAKAGNPKAHKRKPDKTKRGIIRYIVDMLDSDIAIDDEPHYPREVDIINPERAVSFLLDGDTYKITLSRKRKPKG